MKQHLIFLVGLLWIWSCQEPTPRKPIHQSKDIALRTSVERNKKIIQSQQKLIRQAIRKDSSYQFESAPAGYWYTKINTTTGPTPIAGDEVTFTFEIQTLAGAIIYPQEELGTINYLVDKEELLPALRYAIKNLRENEKGIFLMPSYLGYGYQGDGEKIGINQPLRLRVELMHIHKNKATLESK